MTNQCQHGQLARVCELCEKDAQIAKLTAEYDHAVEQAAANCDEVLRLREALELIAMPMRPDGTWNRERLACQQLAFRALRKGAA